MIELRRLSVGLVVATALAAPAWAGDAPPPRPAPPTVAARMATWTGYLFRDREGRLRVGTPVVAMGVLSVPPRVVAGALAERLGSWVSGAADDWFFLNYTLETSDGPSKVPTYLVTLRGEVDRELADAFPGSGSQEPITMKGARLTAVERLDRDWLGVWALVFRERASPWRVARDVDTSADGVRAFAEKAVEALKAMRARPGPDDTWRAAVRAVDADAVVSEAFRRDKERELQRWLVHEDERRGWRLPGLVGLPPLPPDPSQVQAILLASPTRAAFLAAVQSAWKGDLHEVYVQSYVRSKGPFGEGTSIHGCTVADIRDAWSDDDYVERRAVTREILHR